jgi:hypothetical protein
MTATPSSIHGKKTSSARAGEQPRARKVPARRASPPPSLGHAGRTIRDGVADTLMRLKAIEADVAALARRTVSDSLAAAGGAADGLGAVVRDVFAGVVDATGESVSALGLGIQGAARGTVAGVQDAGGDLSRAASEIVKSSIIEGHRVGAEIGSVARAALAGISQGLAEAGKSAAAIATSAARDALATAMDISALAAEGVRQVVRGTAEGVQEVAKKHRAEREASSTRSAVAPAGRGSRPGAGV